VFIIRYPDDGVPAGIWVDPLVGGADEEYFYADVVVETR
jgi:hypothetical protein